MSPKNVISCLCLSLRHPAFWIISRLERRESKTAEFNEASPKICYSDIASLEIKLAQMVNTTKVTSIL
jgi:hypothetical protein